MPAVLTTASRVTCRHTGTVSVTSTEKLQVRGRPVLRSDGVVGKQVGGCTTPLSTTTPPSNPCTTTVTVTSGAATKLTSGGQPVVLDTLSGATDGVAPLTPPPPQTFSARAEQQLLLSA